MDERTEEWLHKTRQLDRTPAIRGGIRADSGALKQTSVVLVGALTVITVLIAAPNRLSEIPPPSARIAPGSDNRVVAPERESGIRIVGAVLPVAVHPRVSPPAGIPVVVPHVAIWTRPNPTGGLKFQIPSELPPTNLPQLVPSNLLTR